MTRVPETSESLLLRIRDPSDFAAWTQFNAIYRPVVYRVARRAGWQDSDAEDLAQRVMMLVARSISDWQRDSQKSGFCSWLNLVARNALISTLRSSHRNQTIGGSDFFARTLAIESPWDELERVI